MSLKVFAMYNITDVTEADIYCVGVEHSDVQCRDLISTLVHTLSLTHPVVIVHEGLESGEVLDINLKMSLCQRNQWPAQVHVVGWDVSESVIRSIGTPSHVLNQIQANLEGTLAEMKLLGALINRKVPTMVINPVGLDLNLDLIQPDIEPELMKLAELNQTFVDGLRKYQTLRDNPVKPDQIDATFPQRTAAMVHTLAHIRDTLNRFHLNTAKIVVVGGVNHFKTDQEHVDDPRYDLSTLYHELNAHHSVILIPTHVWD